MPPGGEVLPVPLPPGSGRATLPPGGPVTAVTTRQHTRHREAPTSTTSAPALSSSGAAATPAAAPRLDAAQPSAPVAAPSVAPDDFRQAFRRHAAGVVVITADAGQGPVGFTATSLASVSLDPPLISFAIAARASAWPTIAAADSAVVHLLHSDAHGLAQRFATSGIDRFAAPTAWSRLATGEPVLHDVGGHLVTRIEHRVAVGDHHLVVARVVDVVLHGVQHEPLLYLAGAYARPTALG